MTQKPIFDMILEIQNKEDVDIDFEVEHYFQEKMEGYVYKSLVIIRYAFANRPFLVLVQYQEI